MGISGRDGDSVVHWKAGTLLALTPRLSSVQVRALIRMGVILRWVAIAFAGLAGLLGGARTPHLLTYEILAALIYNGLVTGVAVRAPDEALPSLALVTTVIDQLFCFTFISLYSIVPDGHQVAAYVPGLLEAVAFFGVSGGILSIGIYLTGVVAAQPTNLVLGHGAFDPFSVFASSLTIILIAVCLTAVLEVLVHPAGAVARSAGEAARGAGAALERPALSAREQAVLRLVAEGCSTATIASRLQVSERLVKASIERLLTQLKARNRAEAVAAAIRSGLL
ncbi:MAG TPA: LuxR C-terminal-related transcriptional regulator [Candidatus Limnocylindrales bacterium]|nr:LuxR C-terminal-related transcriptional regulator [Candidatus Limnocylindrales bacterium]